MKTSSKKTNFSVPKMRSSFFQQDNIFPSYRALGDLSDYVSQFVVNSYYSTQINYKGTPVRVQSLEYGASTLCLSNVRVYETGTSKYVLLLPPNDFVKPRNSSPVETSSVRRFPFSSRPLA